MKHPIYITTAKVTTYYALVNLKLSCKIITVDIYTKVKQSFKLVKLFKLMHKKIVSAKH